MYIGLHVKYLLFLSDLMKLEISRKLFEVYSNTKFHAKSVQWEPSCSMWTERNDEATSGFPQFCE